jgi:hypothetical protein
MKVAVVERLIPFCMTLPSGSELFTVLARGSMRDLPWKTGRGNDLAVQNYRARTENNVKGEEVTGVYYDEYRVKVRFMG